jgi:hypothetical protein
MKQPTSFLMNLCHFSTFSSPELFHDLFHCRVFVELMNLLVDETLVVAFEDFTEGDFGFSKDVEADLFAGLVVKGRAWDEATW